MLLRAYSLGKNMNFWTFEIDNTENHEDKAFLGVYKECTNAQHGVYTAPVFRSFEKTNFITTILVVYFSDHFPTFGQAKVQKPTFQF